MSKKMKEAQKINVLGKENMPKTCDLFQDLKYNDISRWEALKDYKKSRSSNMISAFTLFKDYETYKQKINDELIGLTTVDGVEIKSQSKHFIERVFGTSQDPKTGKPRSGVEIKDIKETLSGASCIIYKKNSTHYQGSLCDVSINSKTGTLIQTNPNGGK